MGTEVQHCPRTKIEQNLAHKQTHPDAQANQTKKKFALLHSINDSLSRQRVQSQGRFEIVSPCKENSKKATPRPSDEHQPLAQSEVTRNSEKNLTAHSTKNSYSLMKTCSDLKRY